MQSHISSLESKVSVEFENTGTTRTMSSGLFMRAQAVKCDFASSKVRSPFPLRNPCQCMPEVAMITSIHFELRRRVSS